MSKFEKILNQITKEELEEYYLNHNIHETALYFNISVDMVTKLTKYYEIKKSLNLINKQIKATKLEKYGDDKYNNCNKQKETIINKYGSQEDFIKHRSLKSKETKVKKENSFENLLLKINKEEFYNLYITQNKSREFIKEKYNLTEFKLDKFINHYRFNKSKKQASDLALKSKYDKYGSKDNYNKFMLDKTNQTRIKKYGSLDNYKKFISNLCSNTWLSKPLQDRLDHAQIVLKHGGGWNHNTSTTTLQNKYGVKNAYALAIYKGQSKINKKFEETLKNNNIQYEIEKSLSQNKSYYRYDFKINNILLELNPWPFHNITFNPLHKETINKDYHFNKTKLALENGFRCIHVFDWDDKDKIISLLKHREKINARDCEIKIVSQEEAKEYLNKYHLQNYAKDNIRLGLYFNKELVSIMTFGKPRYNKNYDYELIRYCSHKYIIGGTEKLFKHFIKTYNPQSIISYCDNSKFKGDIYLQLGFTLKNYGSPSKHWYNIKTGRHITHNLLRQRGFDQLFGKIYGCFGKGTDNEQLMRDHGFVEIYDCGQSVYIYNKGERDGCITNK